VIEIEGKGGEGDLCAYEGNNIRNQLGRDTVGARHKAGAKKPRTTCMGFDRAGSKLSTGGNVKAILRTSKESK
jgi:hypothetical protein